MSETPKSRMFGLTAVLTRMKSRLGYAHVLALLMLALVFSVWCETVTAQTTVIRGRFVVHIGAGFTQPQIESLTRAIEYWDELSPEGPDFIYSVALGDLGAPDPITGGFVVASTSRTGVVFNNNAALNLDTLYTTAANTQLKQLPETALLNWEDILIHEIGHPMGFWGDTAWNPATGELVGFADTINHYTSLLRDRNGTWAAPGLQFTNPGAPNYFNPSDVTFWGEEAMAVFGDVWADGTETAVPMFPGTIGGSSLSHINERIALQFWLTQSDTRPFYSEVELAIFNDANDPNLPNNIDIRNFFGRSFYQTHTGVITVDNDGNPFDLSGRFGVGLHLVAGGNTVVLDTDIITRGYAGAGVRVEGDGNTLTIGEGVRVVASGVNAIGALVTHNTYGNGSTLINQGRIDAAGPDGTGVWFNVLGNATRFYNSGIINAGEGNNAIYVSHLGEVGTWTTLPLMTGIDLMQGTTIVGNIVNAIGPENWQVLTFGRLADAQGRSTFASDPDDFEIRIYGSLIGPYDMETWGGTTTIEQDLTSPGGWLYIGRGDASSTLILRGDIDGLEHATVLGSGTLVAAGSGGGTRFTLGYVDVYTGGTLSPSVSTNDLGRLTIENYYTGLFGYSLFLMEDRSTLRVDLGVNNDSDRITIIGQNEVDPETDEVLTYNATVRAINIDLTTINDGVFTLVQAQTAGALNYSPASVAGTAVLANGIPIEIVNLYGRKGATTSVANINDTSLQLSVAIFETGRIGNYHLSWTGLADGTTWDVRDAENPGTENWRDDAAFSVWFENGDSVTFGLSGTNTISIIPDGVIVGDMFVIGEGDWIFNGNIGGVQRPITDIATGMTTPSSGGLFMNGTGTITLNGENRFVGDIMLGGGVKVVDDITYSRTVIDGDSYELSTDGDIHVGNTGYASLYLLNDGRATAANNVYIGGAGVLGDDGTGLLAGNGILRANSVIVSAAGVIAPGEQMAPFDTLTIVGNLQMADGSTLLVELGTAGQSSNVAVGGTADVGAININLSSLVMDGTFFSGAFTLIASQGLTYQTDSALIWLNGREIPLTIGRWTVLDAHTTNTGTDLQLTLDGALNNYYLDWTGNADGTSWDFTTENWFGYNPNDPDDTDTRFVDGDRVRFGLDGSHVINIEGTRVIVSDMLIEGGGTWVFNGNILASVSQTTHVDATGMLLMDSYDPLYGTYGLLSVTLNGDNEFEGGATVIGSTLYLNGDNVFGGLGIVVYSSDIYVGDGGEAGSISGDIYLYGSDSGGNSNITFNRSNDSVFSDNITGIGGSLTKLGAGELALQGNNTYTGLTSVEHGTIVFGSLTNSIGAVDIRTGANLRGVGDATDISTAGAVRNNGGTIENLGNLLITGTLTNAGTIRDIAGTLTASEVRNTGGAIYNVTAIEVSYIGGGGEWDIINNPDGTQEYVWYPGSTAGEWSGTWALDPVNGKYYVVTENPDGSYTYEETVSTDAWGPYRLDLEYTPHEIMYGNFTNGVDSYLGETGSLRAMNVSNGGIIEMVGTITIYDSFDNTGYLGEFGSLTARSVDNSGTIIGYVNSEEQFISEMHVTDALTNRSGANIAGLRELTAASVDNRGGMIGGIDNLVVEGEISNVVVGGREGTIFSIGNLQAGSVHNDGIMRTIGTMNIEEGVTNLNRIEDIGSMTVGTNLTNSGYFANVDTLTVGNGILNTGSFINVNSVSAYYFENQYAAVVGGVSHLNMNGGTFNNQGGIIIVGETGIDTSGEPFFTKIDVMKIDGDFVSASGLFIIGVNDSSTKTLKNSVIEVTGSATINGGIVSIVVEKGMNYVATGSDYKYVFLDAQGGLNVEADLLIGSVDDPLLKPVARYDESQYWFFLERTFLYAGEGETMNQRAMGVYLDEVGIYPSGDYRNVLMALDHTRAGDTSDFTPVTANTRPTNDSFYGQKDPIPTALAAMGGSIYGTMTTASLQNTVMFHASLTNMLRRDYNDVGGVYDQIYRGQERQRQLYGNRGVYNPTNNLWGMVYGHSGTMHSDGNAGKYSQGFFGIMAGFDRINERRLRMGLFLSMGEGSLSGELKDRMISKEFMAGHYLRKDSKNSYLLIQAGLGTHRYDTTRKIFFGGYNPAEDIHYIIDRTAKNNHNAFLATAHIETGLRYRGGIFNISPFVGAQYTGLFREGFTERGAASLNLTTNSKSFDSFRVMFGMRFDSEAFRWRRGLASFYGNVAWMYEFEPSGSRHTKFTARFSDAGLLSGTPKFTVYGNDPGRDWVQAGFGVKHDIHAHLRAFIGYDAYANMNQVMHSGNLGFVWEL